MISQRLLLIICLILASCSTSLRLDLGSRTIAKGPGYERVHIPCKGGSGDYDYTYTDLPNGWEADGWDFHIPFEDFEKGGVFGLRVKVFDKKL